MSDENHPEGGEEGHPPAADHVAKRVSDPVADDHVMLDVDQNPESSGTKGSVAGDDNGSVEAEQSSANEDSGDAEEVSGGEGEERGRSEEDQEPEAMAVDERDNDSAEPASDNSSSRQSSSDSRQLEAQLNSTETSASDFKVSDAIEATTQAEGQAITTALEAAQSDPTSIRELKDYDQLKGILQNTSSQVAQKALREFWRLFLFSKSSEPQSVPHLIFVLRAGLKNASTSVAEKVLSLGGFSTPELVNVLSKKNNISTAVLKSVKAEQILEHVSPAVLNQVVGKQIQNLPKEILNRAISEHIKKLPAKQLVNMLAKAGRLGYNESDIIDEDETVMPDLSQYAARYVAENSQPQPAHPSASNQFAPGPVQSQYQQTPTPAHYAAHAPYNCPPPHQPQYFNSPVTSNHNNPAILPSQQQGRPYPPQNPPTPNGRTLAATNMDPLLAEQERNRAIQRQELLAAAERKAAEGKAALGGPKPARTSTGGIKSPVPQGRECDVCHQCPPSDSGYRYVSFLWTHC